jgi:hypothetical protein
MEWLSRQGLIMRKGRQYQSFKHGEDNRLPQNEPHSLVDTLMINDELINFTHQTLCLNLLLKKMTRVTRYN